MKLRVLGCSGGVGRGLRTTSMLIDDDILIDAGSGVGDLTLEEMRGIRHVFLTHSHMDHFAFLPLLVDSIFDAISDPIVVHGRPETLLALKTHVFNWTIWPDFGALPSFDHPVMRYQEMAPGDVELIAGRRLEMIAVNHIVPGAGYRVQGATGSFAFSGDTTINDTFWNALNRHPALDLLIVEAAFTNEDDELSRKSGHYTPAMLGSDFAKLRHHPRVFLSHTKPGQEETILQQCRALPRLQSISQLNSGDIFEL